MSKHNNINTRIISALRIYQGRLAQTLFLFIGIMAYGLADAWAQTTVPMGTCTNSSDYAIPDPTQYGGLFSSIADYLTTLLSQITGDMFLSILHEDSAIRWAIGAAVTLYIAIYGIMFIFGLVQMTLYDFMIRLVKIGIVASLMQTPAEAMSDFNNTIGAFFNTGTDQIISAMSTIFIGGDVPMGPPFWVMDSAILYIVSPKMASTLIAAFTTGPYGLGIGLLLVMAFGSYVKAMMNAMWVYIMALVMRSFMFALAPLFIPCILFNRTKPLFDGWLNQIVNSCLQPIFLFTFFTFFTVLMIYCINLLFFNPTCWTGVPDAFRGTPFEGQFWRFAIWDYNLQKWVPFDGKWDFGGPVGVSGYHPVHPVGIVLPITLWILADLAARFNNIVVDIAKDIAMASTDLRMGAEKLSDWATGGPSADGSMGGKAAGPMQAVGAAGGVRTGPSGFVGSPGSGNALSKVESAVGSSFGKLTGMFKDMVGNRPPPSGK